MTNRNFLRPMRAKPSRGSLRLSVGSSFYFSSFGGSSAQGAIPADGRVCALSASSSRAGCPLVACPRAGDLLLRAKHLFIAARTVWQGTSAFTQHHRRAAMLHVSPFHFFFGRDLGSGAACAIAVNSCGTSTSDLFDMTIDLLGSAATMNGPLRYLTGGCGCICSKAKAWLATVASSKAMPWPKGVGHHASRCERISASWARKSATWASVASGCAGCGLSSRMPRHRDRKVRSNRPTHARGDLVRCHRQLVGPDC